MHHETVKRAIGTSTFASRPLAMRRRTVDPYVGHLAELLEQVPKVRAPRATAILRDRGFKGSVYQVRRILQELRKGRSSRAFQRLTMTPGEQAQCDWAHCGTLTVGRAKRKLSCFVMVLSYSRLIYARFTFDQTVESFLRGHVEAFSHFGGAPRVILYDNLKSAVLERFAQSYRFNPALLELAGHYHFEPRPCNVARGNEKGRVERTIGYLRTGFLPARNFRDLNDANEQLSTWLLQEGNVRPWPQDPSRSISDVASEDRDSLLALPQQPIDLWHRRLVRSDKTAYVRFDLNDYSVPPEVCRKPLTLLASENIVRIFDRQELVVEHARSYDKGQVIAQPGHNEAIRVQQLQRLPARRREAITAVIPAVGDLLKQLVERGEPLHTHLRTLYDLVEKYGVDTVAGAVDEALAQGSPRAESVAHIIDYRRQQENKPPLISPHLPDRPGVRDLVIKHHDLGQYDTIAGGASQKD